MRKPVTMERFWAKVDVRGPDECWEWRGARGRGGYGRAWVFMDRFGAHVIALMMSGTDVPSGKLCLHRCDNPPCCNPAHLYAGTPFDNASDKIERRRQSGVRNIDVHNMFVLWRATRHLPKGDRRRFTQQRLARMYGITHPMVSYLVRGMRKTYKGLPLTY